MIELIDVSHSYMLDFNRVDRVSALQNLNLRISEGEYIAIVGHNASGKSTLAKLLNGLISPTQGEVWVDGTNTRDRDKVLEVKQKVGIVFQNPDNQLVAAVVEEEVAFGLENLRIPTSEIKVRINEALQAVGMSQYVSHTPHLLSGGQKQRIAIAGVMAMRPKYLVLDEPTSLLDPEGRDEVLEILIKLNREYEVTIVQITHFPEEAALAKRVLVMQRGKIVADLTPQKLFSQVERLREMGIDAPQMAILARMLKESGVQIASDVITVEEMVSAISNQLSANYSY